jgi:hypothetical protein
MTGTVPWAGEPTPANQGRLMMLDWHDQLLPAQDPHSGYPGFGVGPGLWFADRMASRYLTLAPAPDLFGRVSRASVYDSRPFHT